MSRDAVLPTPRLLRRYGNRKLYDTQARRYVTLGALARLVASGQEVRVVDQATGEDLTAVVLAQVVLEGLRERTARIPGQVLSALVRLGAGRGPAAAEWSPARAAARARQEAERIARRVVGRLSLDEALALRQEIAEAVQRGVAEAQQGLQARLGGLLRRLEKEASGHAAVRALREWVAWPWGTKGRKERRPSWREATARRPRAKARGRGGRRGKPRKPPATRPRPSSATGGRPRSGSSRRPRRSSRSRSARWSSRKA